MTPDQIREALGAAVAVPADALRAGQEEAAVLAPGILALAEKAARGVWLLPAQQNVLFYGLYILAAAKQTQGFPALLSLLRRPDEEMEALFGDALGRDGASLIVSLFDGDPEPLYAFLADPGTSEYARWSVFKAMARLCFDGQIDRPGFVTFLARFDDERLAPSQDVAWMGWQEAICLLGLEDFQERVRAAWDDERGEDMPMPQVERDDWIDRLHDAADAPTDPTRFMQELIEPIGDAAAALAWIEAPPAEGGDPGDGTRLSGREIDWLAGFLESDRQPPQTMDIETLDGFFAAVAAIPEDIPPAEYLALIWGDDGEEPVFDDGEQRTFVQDLLSRHMAGIRARIAAGMAHEPVLLPTDRPTDQGVRWSEGFGIGTSLREEAWDALAADREAGDAFADIAALSASLYDAPAERLSAREREAILDALPDYPALFARVFRDGPRSREPVRAVRIGRNDPCPCGSGKKFKKCHGAPGAAPLN